jgi:LmbE family N-acetylglucosaminyl deacetylase
MSFDGLNNSLLADPLAAPLLEAETVRDWGRTLIVAPHPDDESLGCGGAIALLRKFDCPVFVVVMSDGTLSHPNSKKYPAPRLRDLRECEMLDALNILGVSADNVRFLRYKDRSVPHETAPNWRSAVQTCQDYLQEVQPDTILVPWRRDPHPDHAAAWKIFAATQYLSEKPRTIEYPIWLWELAEGDDAPRQNEAKAWRLNIAQVIEQKQAAIRAHRSQTTDLIDDDPTAFRLTPEILTHFAHDWEIYLENL